MCKVRLNILGSTSILLLCLFSIETHALPRDYQAYPTDPELKYLPSYCTVRLRHGDWKDPLYQKALRTFGPDFEHVHHFCVGLNLVIRYNMSSDAEDKKHFLKAAIGEFNYMTGHAKEGFVLMPEIYLNRGKVYSMMGQDFHALTDMTKAIELNPQLIKGYLLIADQYEKVKEKQKALEIISVGLQHNPDSKGLQDRYLELGGKPPFPDPIIKQQATPEKKEPPVIEEKPSMDNAGTSSPPPAKAPESPADQPKIGSPSNPYCRFCTD